LGVLAVYYDHLHEFSNEEISVLSAFSQFLAVSIEDIRVFQSLANEKQKTESIVFSLHDGLLVYGLDGKIIEANPRAEEILGLSRSKLLGLDPRTLDDSGPAYLNLRSIANLVIDEYGVQDVELTDESGLTLRVSHVPLQTQRREKLGFIHLLHDISRANG
jgi:PAS domain S-box-containing protein